MDKFNIPQVKRSLIKINKENGKDVNWGIQILVNNCELYNTMIDKFEAGNQKSAYLLYQMSSTIFNQLAAWNIYIDKKNAKSDSEDTFTLMKQKVEKRTN